MRHTKTFFTAVCIFALTMSAVTKANAAAGTQQPQSFKKKITTTISLDYLLFLPQDYDARKSKRWPLILFLHGAGERGSDIEKVTMHGPPKIVKTRPDFQFMVVSPQCPNGQTWNADALLALMDEVTRKHKVDPRRIYLTGLSMGGYGSWSLGLKNPERFAAIAPICGGGDPINILLADKQRAQLLQSLPVWAFHGGKDPVVKLEASEKMIEALKKIGNDARLTVYPEAGHDSWTETYNNPQLYEWFLQHQRAAGTVKK